jgi:alkane 1-monooxygenase
MSPWLRNTGYFLSLAPALLVIWGNLQGSWWTASNLLFSFGFLAILEVCTGSEKSNLHSGKADSLPVLVLILHTILHSVAVFSLFYGIYTGTISGGFVVAAVLSTGAEAGSGAVVIAHEWIHRSGFWSRLAGKYLLFSSGNIYFYVHHLRIHHKLVGQQGDAATARLGESLYHFYLRTVREQLAQAWASEARRLERSERAIFSLKNELLRNVLLQLVFLAAILFFLGWQGLPVYLAYILLASLLLEYVNYIEHYGLTRGDGERVGPMHSWNSDKWVSRFMLIDLSRHADHHFHPSKPYHTLDTHEQSPLLPGGYASLVLPAMLPPWWFRLVHKRIPKAQFKYGEA